MTPASRSKSKIETKSTHQELEAFSFTRDLIPQTGDDNLWKYRLSAWESYQALPFPDRKDEAWRRTDIQGLNTAHFVLPVNGKTQDDPLPNLTRLEAITEEEISGQIITGMVSPVQQLNPELAEEGVIFLDFRTAEMEHPELLGKLLGKIVQPDEDKFTALAAALAEDGIFLYVPKGVVVKTPLHSLYWGAGEGNAFINHMVIWLEDGAQATFVHESASAQTQVNGQILHAGIVEIHVGKGAHLNFVELQSWGESVWSFSRERAQVLGDGKLDWIYGAMGTHLSKNFSDIDLVEPGAVCRMSGFYFANGDQHLDHDTQQNHLAKHTTSDLLYKGAVLDKSRSVWQGMIYVAPGAVGADGYQANRNLILSKGTHADSIPGLEILADDVRCTHGATVGKIDENEIFYLLSRGIPRKEAEQLIVMGFFAQILERVPFEGVQRRFTQAIREKMAER